MKDFNAVYRNKKMLDTDFYLTGEDEAFYKGFWISRRTKNRFHKESDTIKKDKIKVEDWEKVDD